MPSSAPRWASHAAATRDRQSQARALDTATTTDLAAKYVALAIDCEQPKLADGVNIKQTLSAYEGVPLIRFRLGICGRPGVPDAGALRAADPRWTDTLYWEGRRELASSIGRAIDLPKVLSLYAEGRDAFPSSVMLTMAWANANMIGEEFEGALSGFDDVLASQPAHRDALNGRMQSLSYLLRHDDAAATATRLLDLGTWHIADANYWRAWNRYHLKNYDGAWADVENAIKGLSSSASICLRIIGYARKIWDRRGSIRSRYELDSQHLRRDWMSGLVSIDQDELRIAAPKFTRGMSCFVSAAAGCGRSARARGRRQTRPPATAREQGSRIACSGTRIR